MDMVYGTLVLKNMVENTDGRYTDAINKAKAAGTAPDISDPDYESKYEAYTATVGRTFWREITITNLVDILVGSVYGSLGL
jgi:hypothetical protein